ncbi:unnamed protein product [Durusdinium trenchii]|uniref:C3H1-type domain-containing protein n=1 Tax=Durusdinium trenchii TaxID=1381693 RepID=A0ABP0P5K2_9DINO
MVVKDALAAFSIRVLLGGGRSLTQFAKTPISSTCCFLFSFSVPAAEWLKGKAHNDMASDMLTPSGTAEAGAEAAEDQVLKDGADGAAEAEVDGEEELIIRIPLELQVPSDISLYNLKRIVSQKLTEAQLVPREDPMSMVLGLNGQVCADPLACPLRMLVPGSVVSLVADVPEAHEVSRLGLCLNAFQLKQVQSVQRSGFSGLQVPVLPKPLPLKLLPDDVMRERRLKLYKTQLCANFNGPTGYCSFGAKCHFAHGESELRAFGGPTGPPTEAPPKVTEFKASKEPKEDWSQSDNYEWTWEGRDGWGDGKWRDDWTWKAWSWDRDWSRGWWRSDWQQSVEWSPERSGDVSRAASRASRVSASSHDSEPPAPAPTGLVLRPVEERHIRSSPRRSRQNSRRSARRNSRSRCGRSARRRSRSRRKR